MDQEIKADAKRPNVQHRLDALENSVEKTRSLFEMLVERLEAVLLPDEEVREKGIPRDEDRRSASSFSYRLDMLLQCETAFQTRIDDVTRRLDL